jgi:hypothetical protein
MDGARCATGFHGVTQKGPRATKKGGRALLDPASRPAMMTAAYFGSSTIS